MGIKVEATIDVLEVDHQEQPFVGERPKLVVKSHCNRGGLVVLVLPNGGGTITVEGGELITACQKAMKF